MATTPANAVNADTTGQVSFSGTAFSASPLTQHDVLIGGASNAITSITPGTSGFVLTSNGTTSDPSFQSATSSGIQTIDGNSGSITGSTVTIETGSPSGGTSGTSEFLNSGTTSTLQYYDSSSNQNVIIGGRVGQTTAISGSSNTGLGYLVWNGGASGTGNVAIGTSCWQNGQSGNNNVAIGANAFVQATGSQNVAIGGVALQNLSTGVYNLCLGFNTGTAYTSSESYNIIVGCAATSVLGESNVTRLGNGIYTSACFIDGITGVTISGTGVLCSASGQLGTIVSSERYKENIQEIPDDVSVMNLRPVKFNYKEDDSKTIKYGLIAEEVEKNFRYLCFYNKDGTPESVNYHELPALLLKELQRLSKRVDELEALAKK